MFRKIIKTFAERSRVKKEFDLEIFGRKLEMKFPYTPYNESESKREKNTNKLSIDWSSQIHTKALQIYSHITKIFGSL